jgi:hypothetical protein
MQYSITSNGSYRAGFPNSPYFGYPMPTHVPNWPIGARVPYPWNTNPFLYSEYGQLIKGEQVAQIAHPSLVIADSILRNYV